MVPLLPALVTSAVARVNHGETVEQATGWLWTLAPSEQRLAVDDWIVAAGHPLGYLPSTRETRFRVLVRETHEGTTGLWIAGRNAGT